MQGKALITRLSELGVGFISWDGVEMLGVDNILAYIQQGGKEENENYSETGIKRSNEWHKGRVAHFYNNPHLIDMVSIKEELEGFLEVEDGNHRLMAAILLQTGGFLQHIAVDFNGSPETWDYLTGVSSSYDF
jgi:hypothetical protein